MIGTVLKDTYRVVELLGEGGMGTIYVAEHKTLPKRYAVKVLKAAEQASAELLARFEREARIASGLGHPNIVEVLDFDLQADGSPFFVLQLLSGEFDPALKALAPYLAAQDRQAQLGAADPELRLGILRSDRGHTVQGLLLLYQGRVEPAIAELRIELKQLSTRSSFDRAIVEAQSHFGLMIAHRLKKGRQTRFRRRAERALKAYYASNGNPHLSIVETLWLIAPLAPDLIAPLLNRWGRPKMPFYADVLVAQAGALARMGKTKDARLLLAKAVSLAPEDRRKGLRQVYRRFLRMCRQVDAHWEKQGLKLPPPAKPIQRRGPGKPGKLLRKADKRKARKSR